MRRAFLNRVAEMIRTEEDTAFFTVDIGMWALREELREFPDRCVNVGIFEDGMMSIAAGMASRGLIPTVFGIQPYLIERAYEQIKLDLAYQGFGVNVVGTGAAVDYPKYGYSHYCPEDLQLIKLLPGCEFLAPGSAKQFLQLFNAAYRDGRPSFFRISDHPNRVYDPDVRFGQAEVMQTGKKALVLAVSVMLDAVMEACSGEDVTVLYYTTLEPFDAETLRANAATGNILLAEPEYEGSLLFDVHKALYGRSLRVRTVGFPREIFRNYGTYEDKMRAYGLTVEHVKEELSKLEEDHG